MVQVAGPSPGDGGLVDPQGNSVSSSRTTIRSYGSPAQTPRTAQDIGKVDPRLADALETMANRVSDITVNMAQMLDMFTQMQRPAEDLNAKLERQTYSLKNTLEVIDDVEEKFDDILEASKSMLNSDFLYGGKVKRDKLLDFFSTVRDNLKEVNKVGLISKKEGDYMIQMLSKVEELIENIKEATEDGEGLDIVNNENLKTAFAGLSKLAAQTSQLNKEIDDLDFGRANDSLDEFGSNLDTMLGGALGKMRSLGKFAFGNRKTSRQIGVENNRADRRAEDIGKQHGLQPGVLRTIFKNMRESGTADISVIPKEKREDVLKDLVGKRGGPLGGIMGSLDNFLGKRALSAIEKGTTSGVGGLLAKSFTGGGGSVLEGLGSVGTSLLGKAALPIKAATTIIDLFDMATEQNTSAYKKLGKGGLVGGKINPYDAYSATKSSLMAVGGSLGGMLSNGNIGMTYEKNLDVMKGIVDAGWGVGDLMTDLEKQGRGAVSTLRSPTNNRSTDMFSGVMKNAYLFGGNLGLDQSESVQQTMKLVDRMGLSIGRVQELFVKVDLATKASGISTTKYLEIMDSVADNFTKMNKSMNITVAILNQLGKTGKYTASDLQDMMKTVLGEKKDVATKAFLFNRMSPDQMDQFKTGYEANVQLEGRNLAEQGPLKAILEKQGLTTEDFLKMDNMQQRSLVDNISNSADKKQIMGAMQSYILSKAKSKAYQSAKNPIELASISENAGEDIRDQAAAQGSAIQMTLEKSGSSFSKLAKGDPEFLKSLLGNQLFKMSGGNANLMNQQLPTMLQDMAQQVQKAINTGGEEGKSELLKLGFQGKSISSLMGMKGKSPEALLETKEMNDYFASGGLTRILYEISDKERSEAEKKAKDNLNAITGIRDWLKQVFQPLMEGLISLVGILRDFLSAIATHFGVNPEDKIKEQKALETWQSGIQNNTETKKKIEEIFKSQWTEEAQKKDPEGFKKAGEAKKNLLDLLNAPKEELNKANLEELDLRVKQYLAGGEKRQIAETAMTSAGWKDDMQARRIAARDAYITEKEDVSKKLAEAEKGKAALEPPPPPTSTTPTLDKAAAAAAPSSAPSSSPTTTAAGATQSSTTSTPGATYNITTTNGAVINNTGPVPINLSGERRPAFSPPSNAWLQ